MRIYCLFFLILLACNAGAVADWPMAFHDLNHTGYLPESSSLPSSDFAISWSFNVNNTIRVSPIAADIDEDRLLEVLFPAGNTLYALSNKGMLLWTYTVNSTIHSAPTVGDLNNDNISEIVFGAGNGVLYVLDWKGDLNWSFQSGGEIHSSPVLADLNDDNEKEVFFTSWDENLYSLGADGRESWRYHTGEKSVSSPAIADINNDNESEIIFGCNNNLLYAVSNPPYKIWMYQVNGNVLSSPVIADLTNDGKMEIIFGAEDGIVYVLYHMIENPGTRKEITRLTSLWNYTTEGAISSTAAAANLDKDSSNTIEVVVGSDDKSVYVLTYAGTRLFKYTVSKPVRTTPALADLNGDSRPEIIFGSDDKGIYIVNHSGSTLWTVKLDGIIRSSPIVADLDGRGILKIVVGTDNGTLYAIEGSAGHNKSLGDGLYDIAESYYISNDLESAEKYASDAKEAYITIKYTEGISESERLLDKIHSMKYCFMARDNYDKGDLEVAVKLAAESERIYSNLNLADASPCRDFFKKANAELYYFEARVFYDQEDYNQSVAYANEAKRIFIEINSTEGLSKVELLLNKTRDGNTAISYYSKALTYYGSGQYELALAYNNEAVNFYSKINHPKGLNHSVNLRDRMNASISLMYADLYYNQSRFVEAYIQASNANKLYERAGDVYGANMSFQIMKKTEAYSEASSLLDTAVKYYNEGNMANASYHASMALKACSRLNETNCIETAKTILSSGEKVEEGTAWIYLIPVILTILLVIAAVAIYYIRKSN